MKHYYLLKPYLIQCRFHIAAGFISLLIVDILQLFIPRIIKWAIDGITMTTISRAGLFRYAFYIVASALMISIFRFFWRYLIMGTARRVEKGMSELLFNHIQTLPASFFDQHTAGDIMAHATNDMTNIRMALGMGIVGLTDTIVLGCAAVFFMAYINLELTLLALLPMPFIALFTKIFSKKLFEAYMDVQAGFSGLMESTRERFAGIRIIKAFNREGLELAAIKKESEMFVKKNMDLVRLRGVIFPLVIFLTQISLAIILGVGGRKVIQTQISPGDFVAFISYLGLLTWPVMAVGWVTNMIQRGAASIGRINAILDIKGEAGIEVSEKKDMENISANPLPDKEEISINGEIEFNRVSFSYPARKIENSKDVSVINNTRVEVLKEVSFRLKHGNMLGIAGHPGSGKSTLLSLITRIYEPDSGSIKIDRREICNIPIQRLRGAISFIPQEPFLFSGTIEENLLFGDPEADSDQIAKVVAMAQLTETIASFPKGIGTIIGEKGVMLSGGQKQRIALARAFLKSSPILILDDPVSQVDMETASNIIKIIESFAGKKNIIVVSHRFSVFRKADHVIVLDKGEILEQGTHLELIGKNGYYTRAWRMQENEDDLLEFKTETDIAEGGVTQTDDNRTQIEESITHGMEEVSI